MSCLSSAYLGQIQAALFFIVCVQTPSQVQIISGGDQGHIPL